MAKRPHERKTSEPNGRGKWQKNASGSKSASGSVTQHNQLKVLPGSVTFRVLCHSSKFGSIIGKGGGIVASIRQETGARIRIEDIVQGCEDRVVVITGSEKEVEVGKEPNKEDSKEDSAVVDGDINEENKGSNDNDEEKVESSALEASKSEKPLSPVQNALLRVYGRLVGGEKVDDTVDDEGRKFAPFSVRLLIYPSQVGCFRGKGGSVIKQMSSDSGAQIRVLSKDQIPLCASPMDEVVQISGSIDSVKKALQSVSKLLLDNPPCERELLPTANPSGPLSQPFSSFPRTEALPPKFFPPAPGPAFPSRPFDTVDYRSNVPRSFPKFHEGAAPGPIQVSPGSITYRLLCSNVKVGSVIGKGGSIIRAIQQETGCEVKVHETAEPEDRIILISGTVFPGDRIFPAQDALLRVHERIVMADNKESMVSTRLIVSSAQIGCLLGKGGSIITEMRKLTGAQIRIMGKDTPRSVAENDELVQVVGEFRTVQDALVQITTRLRDHLFRDINVPSVNHTAHPFDQMPQFGPYVGRREPSPTRMYPNLPPQFQNESTGRPHEERPFPHTPGAHFERMPPGPWAPQGMREGGGTMPMPDFSGAASQRRIGGFPGGNQPTITVDVVVPRALVPSIYGEDGFCLKRIREISEAKITITEPRPEATETVILISGIPEQTHAAQSLLQAFVLSESAAG